MAAELSVDELRGQVVRAQAGRVRAMGENGRSWESAIIKEPFAGTVQVDVRGITGDEHTGFDPDRALCCHPVEHYRFWQSYYRKPFPLGIFGENLTVRGLLEEDVCIGDVMRLGSVIVQVTQPRTPCWKQNQRVQEPDFIKRIERTGRRGWMMRVLEPGEFVVGDDMVLLNRPHPDAFLAFINRKFTDKCDAETAHWIAALTDLGTEYRDHFTALVKV